MQPLKTAIVAWRLIPWAFFLCACQARAGECIQPAVSIRSIDSPFAFASAAAAALATADFVYRESLLAPENIVKSNGPNPAHAAKQCVDRYIAPFLRSSSSEIRDAAGLFTLAMATLDNNERDLQDNLLRLDSEKVGIDQLIAYRVQYVNSGGGRWYVFMNAATATLIAIGQHTESPKGLTITLEMDEKDALRLDVVRLFPVSELGHPERLKPSPQKGAAMMYVALRDGRIDFSNPEWK